MYEASFYTKLDDRKVECTLCPRNCVIEEGKFGNCNARRNRNGILSSEVYSRISAMNMDPVEKKPLYHFFPGKEILSIGTTGCNLHCVFCQNHTLSQCNNRTPVLIKNLSPSELTDVAIKTKKNIGLAFTYNEPSINYEFVMEFSDLFYKKYTKATLKPVLKTIKRIHKSGKHIELTNLVIPTINDDEDEFEAMCKWITNETGKDTVLHLSRYFPRYELSQYPTPAEMLFNLYDIAKSYLNHVYIGNMATEIHSNTFCPNCNATLIERTYVHINQSGIDDLGNCIKCGTNVIKYV